MLVLVSRRYNYTELWVTLKMFIARGHTFEIASTHQVIRSETSTDYNRVQRLVSEVPSMKGFDGIVIISGNPEDTEKFWYDRHVQDLVQEASRTDLTIAGICAAVPAIRPAVRNKKVSYYPLIRSRDLLTEAGALLQTTSLSTDGRVVTAENESVTTMWATNICDVAEGKSPTYVLNPSTFKRKLRERKPIKELEALKKITSNTGKKGLK